MELEDVSFQFLQEITDGFSEKRILGEGAFGVVYKGVTKNGDDVAVKKLKLRDVNLDFKQFQNEFYNLTKLKHQNIVQILGYCFETEKKPLIMHDGSKVFVDEIYTALCFEYLHNGSLQKHLSDEFYELDWHTRFKIIKGTCEGLKYIHEERIYHLDLKPDNILLDKDMVPKIADFGLSRIFGKELARISRHPYGTPGYQPPEYIDKGEISGKFDIFSLGVVIIKIVSRPEGYPKCLDLSSVEFIDQVLRDWRNRLEATCTGDLLEAYCRQVETCTQVALNCVEIDSQKRPDITKITEKLNKLEFHTGKVPKKGCHRPVSIMTMHNSKIEMRTESKDVTDQHQNIILRSDPICNELELNDALETSSDIVEEEHIVGRREEKEKVMASLLKAMPEKIVILPIHGIGGIGKTTFARLIYNDPKFKGYSRVWVHVSQRFYSNKIYKSIILQLSGIECLDNEREKIRSCLEKLLPGRKIMIVLDDLWEDNQFELQELKDMLYHDDSNIIVLVTTRNELVAQRICTNIQPHKILPLTNDMCWDIIKQRSGFKDRNDKEQLMGIGLEIAQKCDGVALAALSLGFSLRSLSFDEWKNVKDSDIWNEPVSKDLSLPNQVLASLRLSYSYMSPCLKHCFTYCAIFPKGHKIVRDDLIYQWIALDFIKPTKLLSNMQLCEKYIVQLLGLSFLQQPVSPKILDGELLRVTRTRSAMPREQNLENKGGFSMPQDDDSKYERDLKKWGKDLKLSRDIESLMTKDEKSGASEAGHDANAQEDLPAQQFSLGSWIGSTTTPGTSRTQRRRKPVVKLIHRKGGTARPCHGPLLAVPQTSPIAGPSTTDIGIFGSSAATNLTSLQYPALPPTTPGSMYTFTATAHSLCLPPTATAKDENKADFGKLSNAPCEE